MAPKGNIISLRFGVIPSYELRFVIPGEEMLVSNDGGRTDQRARGGAEASDIGREGPRYSICGMTEERVALFND